VPNPALVLEDISRLSHHIAHASGDRRRWLIAEMRILLGRLDASDPRVTALLAEVATMEQDR
jgi:hypothetical protein